MSHARTTRRAVMGWTSIYTRSLPTDERDRRLAEIRSDLHEEITGGARPTAVLARALRGVPDDITWARRRRSETRHDTTLDQQTRWTVPLAIVLGPLVFGAVFVLAMTGAGAEGLAGTMGLLLIPVLGVGLVLAAVFRLGRAARLKHRLRVVAGVCGAAFAMSLVAINVGPDEGPEGWWLIFVGFGMFTAVPVGLAALLTSLFVRRDPG